ncbi:MULTISPECIES: AEC family transporter [Streptomyces]|uniref:AEC family transporter n=1 Tax=Streptomyces ramulosus TaxID=47762 RepID=A0ABW1FBD7_9ACTN
MITQLISIVLPIGLCAGLGALWDKFKQPVDTAFVTSFVSNVGFPCLLLSSLDRPGLTLGRVAQTFAAGALAVGCFAVLGLLALKVLRLRDRRYLPALMLPNTGNLGIPIAYFVVGDDGLVFAVAFSTLIQIGHVTLGAWLASGHMSPRQLIKNPMLYALALALAKLGLHIEVPVPLAKTLELLGGVTLPLMLFMLGISLARLHVGSLSRSLFLSFVRVGGGFLVGLLLAAALGLSSAAATAFVIQCSMPVAVLSHMLAQKYEGPSGEIAEMVLASTVLTVVTLPLLVKFA